MSNRMVSSRSELGMHNLDALMDGADPDNAPVQRWDGSAGLSYEWEGLGNDTDLNLSDANCLVYLHTRYQSEPTASFKLPFQELLSRRCFPLIERFLITDGPTPRTPTQLLKWSKQERKRPIELYIPPPSMANKEQAFAYNISTRNFFACIFGKPVVGKHLGLALVALLHSMHEFLSGARDNVGDFMTYMEDQGYLDIANKPNHALAVLYVAESFQFNDLYIRAFAHCVGMSDQLYACSEYEQISSTSKKMIRQEKAEMDFRVHSASDMLRNFLDDELSEAHLGIPSSARAHLERFRSFLMSFYTTSLGYYPPRFFNPTLCRTMLDGFEALYNLLVDDSYSSSGGMPRVASGGICTLQLVQMFDQEHQYESLEHPLPLLPEVNQKGSTRLMPWRPRLDKLRPSQRLTTHTALIKASNWETSLLQNDLVKAYRKFEEEFIFSPNTADKLEKVPLVDARKVQWILVYAVYQVLRNVTTIPTEVFDADKATYHVSISTENLPPWSDPAEIGDLLRRQTDLAVLSSPSIYWADSAGSPSRPGKIEIKPDIDYFALSRRGSSPIEPKEPEITRSDTNRTLSSKSSNVSRASRALSRSSTIRRSMKLLRPSPSTPPPPMPSPSKAVYHQIVVQGYGNGTNAVNIDAENMPSKKNGMNSVNIDTENIVRKKNTANFGTRSDSTASNSGSSAQVSSPDSLESDYSDSTGVFPSPITPISSHSFPLENKAARTQRRDVKSMVFNPTRAKSDSAKKRPKSILLIGGKAYTESHEPMPPKPRQSSFGEIDLSQMNTSNRFSAQPRIADDDEWASMQAFMDGPGRQPEMREDDGDVKPAWEQYADLGGLTEAR